MLQKFLHLWGEKILIKSTKKLHLTDRDFVLHHVQASDDTTALLEVFTATIASTEQNLEALIFSCLSTLGLTPLYCKVDSHSFLARIEPITDRMRILFTDSQMGIVLLVNGQEPGGGTLSLEHISVEVGDTVQVFYRISKEAREMMVM